MILPDRIVLVDRLSFSFGVKILHSVGFVFLAYFQRLSDPFSSIKVLESPIHIALCTLSIILFIKIIPQLKSYDWNIWYFIFLLVLIASTLWSEHPIITLKNSSLLIATSLYATYLFVKFDFNDFILIITLGLLIVLTLSLLLTILAPSKVIHSGTVHIGAWKGIYYHKSGFGREMGILGLLLLFTGKGIWRYLVFVLCLFLVYKSQSAISLLTIVGASFYLLTERILSRIKELKNHTNKIILAGIAGFIAFIASDFASFMELIGKDITLTGRLQIWLYSIFSIREHLWFGYGFESFWQDQTLTHNLGWTINHAHNMIFDILLDGGILLLVPFLMLIVTFFKNLRSLLSNPHLASVIITSFSMIILISFMEETIYVPFDLKWIYTSCLVFYVSNPGKTKNFNNYSFQIWGGS